MTVIAHSTAHAHSPAKTTAAFLRWSLPAGLIIALSLVSVWVSPVQAQPSEPVLLKNISPTFDSNPNSFEVANGMLFFSADDGSHGEELWLSDGTITGTVMVRDINPGATGSNPGAQKEVNGVVFFKADDGSAGTELWASDGTITGTVMVKDIRPGGNSSMPSNLQDVGGTLYFQATDGAHGVELWKSNGTITGTVMVKDIHPASSSSPNLLTDLNGTLFFIADDGTNGLELWKSDGSESGTMLVKDIQPGPTGSSPKGLVVANGLLYFAADDGTHGLELWKSDGSAGGTVLVKDIQPGAVGSALDKLTASNGLLFFAANDATHGLELWKSNGTESGTILVKDIFLPNVYGDSSAPSNLTDVGGMLFFNANDGSRGRELWKSDGTEAGTLLVRDIITGPANSRPSHFAAASGTLFFRAESSERGVELWKSNGTEASTLMVKDIYPDAGSSDPLNMTGLGNRLFFSADDGVHGRQLWLFGLHNDPPFASANAQDSGEEGSEIQLQVNASDPDDDVLTFRWTADSPLCTFSDPTSASPALICVDNGIFSATQTAYDWWNVSVSTTVTVTVENALPVIVSSSVITTAPLSVTLGMTFTDAGSQDTHTATVSWGDGSTEAVSVDQATRSFAASHPFATSGAYELVVTVTDNDGGGVTQSSTIQVSLPLPPDPVRETLHMPLLQR
ncbi:MAG: hyalin [Caldilineaceae bacterium]|nr:hyalin [Caldilineaceae bacterium]